MIEGAAEILRLGGLVAFPTETVYGVGADATNPTAVERIFSVKRRPATNPLIVHVYSSGAAQRYVTEWPESAQKLTEACWPGPLTLVLPKQPIICEATTAGLGTVGLRVPNHPVALAMLREFGGAVAAPSANRSSRVSPTTAGHVRDELGDDVDLILDGGPCDLGIESTVLDLSVAPPRILRPGHVTVEQIRALIGDVTASEMKTDESTPATSPGQFERHYAPQTLAFRFEPSQRGVIQPDNAAILDVTLDPQSYARNFYARLRMLDAQALRAIYIEMPPNLPEWAAVRDRIIRATLPL